MAHCFPPTGLCQRQKNHLEEEAQERVRGEPSVVMVPAMGEVLVSVIPVTAAPSNRRASRRGAMADITGASLKSSSHPLEWSLPHCHHHLRARRSPDY